MLALAAAGCGGSSASPATTTATAPPVTLGPTGARTVATQIVARLKRAGYVVYDVTDSSSAGGGGAVGAANVAPPQVRLAAMTLAVGAGYSKIESELKAITAVQRARALANKPIPASVVARLDALSIQLKDVVRKQLGVAVFSTSTDAQAYVTQVIEPRNKHVLSLPGVGDIQKSRVDGAIVYLADVVETSGKYSFDAAAFDRLVAKAQGAAS